MVQKEDFRRRPRIGLIISHLEDDFDDAVCEGAMIGAEQADVDLVIFPGRYIDGVYADKLRTEYEYQYNTLFDLPANNRFDALLVLIGTIGSHLNKQQKADFLKKYDGIPVITITSEIEGYPCVTVDNTTGLVQVIEHLIDAHGCRKLGFVSGPDTSDDANARLAVFKDTLEKHGLEFKSERVVYGNFSKYVAPKVHELLDRCPDLDAIVCANDQMATAAFQALEERGLRPGKDIAVTGFDNDPVCQEVVPHLTTVKSDPAELGYNSVIEAINLINNGKIEKDSIPSSMVIRNSCGCTRNARMGSISLREGAADSFAQFVEEVCDYLLDKYRSSEKTHLLREHFKRILLKIDEYVHSENLHDRRLREGIAADLDELLGENFFRFITMDDLYSVIEYIHSKYTVSNINRDEQLMINRLFIQIYKIIAERNAAFCKDKLDDNYFMTWQTNSITRDMLVFEAYDDRAYQSVVDKLFRLHMTSSYLFVYEPMIVNKKTDTFKVPEKIFLKCYHDRGESVILPPEEQAISPDKLFSNKYLPDDRRCTMVVTPLFSNEEHYGLLFCEIEHEYFNYITSVSVQLCAALRIITMMKAQAHTQKMLRQSLIEIKENNTLLSEISKTDELTGCLNRRGFFEEVRRKLNDERLVGDHPYSVMIFADLDSLKIINDRFGHEEGDFAIRSAAEILKRSFRDEIIGRIGGDEFVVCTFFKNQVDMQNIREHIESVGRKYNEENAADKEYIIHTSVGVYPFNCSETVEIGELLSHADSLLYEQKRNKKSIIKADHEQ